MDAQYRQDHDAPFVAIVVLNYNGAQLTIDCVESVLRTNYPNFKVIVVDNASTDNSVARLVEKLTDPLVQIFVNSANEGWAGGCNRGMEIAYGIGAKYISVLNNDMIAERGWLAPLVRTLERDHRVGIVGCPIMDVGYPASFGNRMSLFTGRSGFHFQPPNDVTDVDYVGGGIGLMRADLAKSIGGFDSRFFLLYEDTDLCFRIRKLGYRVCAVASPVLHHLGSRTVLNLRPIHILCQVRNRVWFVRRHGGLRHWVVFNILAFGYYYPKLILGRLARSEFRLLMPVLKGIWAGYFRYPGPGQEISSYLAPDSLSVH